MKRRWKAGVALAVLADAVAPVVRGYPPVGNVVVRCGRGHLFTTLWIPGVSLTSLRLGWWRFQRCPVGRHWSFVSPVSESRLSGLEQRRARGRHDIRLP